MHFFPCNAASWDKAALQQQVNCRYSLEQITFEMLHISKLTPPATFGKNVVFLGLGAGGSIYSPPSILTFSMSKCSNSGRRGHGSFPLLPLLPLVPLFSAPASVFAVAGAFCRCSQIVTIREHARHGHGIPPDMDWCAIGRVSNSYVWAYSMSIHAFRVLRHVHDGPVCLSIVCRTGHLSCGYGLISRIRALTSKWSLTGWSSLRTSMCASTART